MSESINMAVVGAGYWGRNYVRNFEALPEARLRWACDADAAALERAQRCAPGAQLSTDYLEVMADEGVQAVAIATNVSTHHAIAMAALNAGKHVLVEKPMAPSVAEAEEMVALAQRKGLTLMVGHLMLYHPAVEHLEELVASGALGRIYYLYASRVNLGRIRDDENALWSFAPHDVSLISHILRKKPVSVSARGRGYLRPDVADVVFLNLGFDDDTMAQIQLSWLDPHKERRLTVVGSKKMVVFDDTHVSEKLRIYDKGFDQPPEYETYGAYLSLRDGDINIPHIPLKEPLTAECRHFLRCVSHHEVPRSPGEQGLEVVRVLEAAEESMRNDGAPERL
ncbi:MAG: Gfo/Idh/MocA family oxidoreductase [Deltaproteobacteria bacterium]|nr:Gfo/Idh/MocA family oxidoreductase [Deltaproteobacteria bacterium]